MILCDCNITTTKRLTGLPDEKEDDLVETLELLDDLKEYRAFYVPLFFSRLGAHSALSKMTLELVALCWKYNMRIWRDSIAPKGINKIPIYQISKSVLDSLEKLK